MSYECLINPGEVDCFCGCVMNFMMFLAYFRDNNQDIITHKWHFSPPRHLVDSVPAAVDVLGTCPGAGILRTSIMIFLRSFYSV